MNFLRLAESNTTDSMGQVNFYQQIDAEKRDYFIIIIIIKKTTTTSTTGLSNWPT